MLSSCSNHTEHIINGVSYDELPQNYLLENAKNDGLVVYEDYDITAGQSVWDDFIAKTENGDSCEIRLMFYYTMDGQGITPEHEQYEEIKDDYPGYYIQDLVFDGRIYTLYWVEEEKEYAHEYKYLKRFDDKSPSLVRYVLVNDDNITWEQIVQSGFSSQYGDWIEHQTVYSKKAE
jgi:hypothetical protein